MVVGGWFLALFSASKFGHFAGLWMMEVSYDGVAFWACPLAKASGSGYPLQVRTRRASSLAGFPLLSLTHFRDLMLER